MPTQILIVEDEKIVALDIQNRLKKLGYGVLDLVATGPAAIAAAAELRPDLVLMDIMLKGEMDGITAAAQIRAELDLPVIYLTALADEATLQRAKITEPYGYLLKPFEERELHSAIEMALYKYRLEKRLRDSERWLNATLNSIGEAVIATDDQGRIKFMNPVAEKLTGWSQAEALGREALEIFQASDEHTRSLAEYPVQQALQQGHVTTLTNHRLITKSGQEIVIDDSAAPIKDETGKITGVVLVFKDITEKRAIQERLLRQERLATAGHLAGGVAHHLNNILTGMLGFAELASYQPNLPAPAQKSLAHIIEQGQRAAHLIRQMLDFSRKSMITRRPLALAAFLKEAASVLRHTLLPPVNLALQIEPDSAGYWVDADAAQLQQALTNLAANAQDAMPGGGTLQLRLSLLRLEPGQTPPGPDMSPGTWLALAVSDTGWGILPEHRPHIFEPFFTTKEVGHGLGMGLAQAYGIIKNHAGDIEVQSQVGQGTTFTLYLPARPTPPPATASAEMPAGHAELLLLLEVDEFILKVEQATLERLGYRVLTATTTQQALEVVKREPQIALVLADVTAPELGGGAWLSDLRQLNPTVKIVVLSSQPPEPGPHNLSPQDFAAWIQKPWTIKQLAQVVSQALAR